jgi:hypothetical protein
MGVLIVVVLPELFRTKRSLSHHSWWRRRWVLAYRTFLWSVPNILPGADVTQNLAASPFAVTTPSAGQPQDFNKLLKAERDHLELAEGMHKWIGDDVETRILKRYGRM